MMIGGQVKGGAGSRKGYPQMRLEHACSIEGAGPGSTGAGVFQRPQAQKGL